MVFKRMMQALGVGGPSVDTVLDNPNCRPGGMLTGQVHVKGGDHPVAIEYIALGLTTRVEVERGDQEHAQHLEFHKLPVSGPFQLAAGVTQSIPFQFPVPWETPITAVYGQHLHGMIMGLRTELSVARAVDKGDLDAVAVHPLPVQEGILGALQQLGFRFKHADLERGHLRGTQQSLPFYQEIEFYAGPQYAHTIKELEVSFVATPQGMDVVLECDKRGGFFTQGHDTISVFHVPHHGAEQVNWAGQVDAWLQQATQKHSGLMSAMGFGGHRSHGYHQPHGHHSGGPGVGTFLAAGAAGVVGGMVLGEVFDEVGDLFE
ncbi:SpoOM family protein [Pseudonocardiaceae bacterium YIM PH 21723]|nr:SpoOM family protein [Pseudonocardiaceae bacterium YIM PH 21723]